MNKLDRLSLHWLRLRVCCRGMRLAMVIFAWFVPLIAQAQVTIQRSREPAMRTGQSRVTAENSQMKAGKPVATKLPKTMRRTFQISSRSEAQRVAGMILAAIENGEPRFPEVIIENDGCAAATADPRTGRVYMMVMNDGLKHGQRVRDRTIAGFSTHAISVAGTASIPNVTVEVSVNVPVIEGQGHALTASISVEGADGGSGAEFVSGLQNPVTVRSRPFTMEPGKSYYAKVRLSAGGTNTRVGTTAVVKGAVFSRVRWNF